MARELRRDLLGNVAEAPPRRMTSAVRTNTVERRSRQRICTRISLEFHRSVSQVQKPESSTTWHKLKKQKQHRSPSPKPARFKEQYPPTVPKRDSGPNTFIEQSPPTHRSHRNTATERPIRRFCPNHSLRVPLLATRPSLNSCCFQPNRFSKQGPSMGRDLLSGPESTRLSSRSMCSELSRSTGGGRRSRAEAQRKRQEGTRKFGLGSAHGQS